MEAVAWQQTQPINASHSLRSTRKLASTATARLAATVRAQPRKQLQTERHHHQRIDYEFPLRHFPVQRLNVPDSTANKHQLVQQVSIVVPTPAPSASWQTGSLRFMRPPVQQSVVTHDSSYSAEELDDARKHLDVMRLQLVANRSAFLSNNIRPQSAPSPTASAVSSAHDIEFVAALRKCLVMLREDAGSLNHRRWFPSSSKELTGPMITRTNFIEMLPELLPQYFSSENPHKSRLQTALLHLLFENHPSTSFTTFFSRLQPDSSPFHGDSKFVTSHTHFFAFLTLHALDQNIC